MTTKYQKIASNMVNDYIFIEDNLLNMYEDIYSLNIGDKPKSINYDEYNKLSTDTKIFLWNQKITYKFMKCSDDEIKTASEFINPIIINSFRNINKRYADYSRCFHIGRYIPLIDNITYNHLKSFYDKQNSSLSIYNFEDTEHNKNNV